MPGEQRGQTIRSYAPTALPSVGARVLAFLAILVGGVCGGLISYSLADLQCGSDDSAAATIVSEVPDGDGTAAVDQPTEDDGCTTLAGLAGLIGAVVVAAGVAVISVLVLRAMAEWRKDPEIPEGSFGPSGDPGPQRSSRSRRKPSA